MPDILLTKLNLLRSESVTASVAAVGRFAVANLNFAGRTHIVRSMMNTVLNIARYAKLGLTSTV